MNIPCAQPLNGDYDSDESTDWSAMHNWSIGPQLLEPEMPVGSLRQGILSVTGAQCSSLSQPVHESGTVDPAYLMLHRGPGTLTDNYEYTHGPSLVDSSPTTNALAMSDTQQFEAEMFAEAPIGVVQFDTALDNDLDNSFFSSQSSDTSTFSGIYTLDESGYISDSTFIDLPSVSFNTFHHDIESANFASQELPLTMPNDFLAEAERHTIVYPLPASTTEPLSKTNPANSEVLYTIIDGKFKCLYAGKDSVCKGSKLYKQPGELRKHQKNHRKPTDCKICGKGFAERKDLDRHKLKHHPDDPSVRSDRRVQKQRGKCPMCPYKGRPDNIKRHMVVHSRQ
ncbi:hypothetical protein QBC36DRAFT_303577 [Triangularia setosa]|uniref:C2H2-type domain-containing protein n=1 Tax=Triangularia setosa TaxID=2587417 RepID=A0AAN6W183_9PEZI|nr:hypothetical protein QBC36DRAFT_303577 [Podospora setosa]